MKSIDDYLDKAIELMDKDLQHEYEKREKFLQDHQGDKHLTKKVKEQMKDIHKALKA